MKTKMQIVDNLLTPSWLSGLLTIACGLAVTGGVIAAFSFNNSQVQQQLVSWQNTHTPALTLPGQNPAGSNNNSLQNTWPLLAFWALIGLVVYFIVESVANTAHEVSELKQELGYVHMHRNELLKDTLLALALRLLAVIAWLIFADIFFRRIIPYSILAAHASASDLLSLSGVLYALLSFTMIALSIHLHAIFLRLVLQRSRVFSTG